MTTPSTFNQTWTRLTLVIAALLAVTGAAGLFSNFAYQRETATWAAQGVGQDAVDFFLVLPALLIATFYARRGSAWALSVWRGILIYLVYSYVLYAFFVHFNALFLLYVAVLGLSFYSLLVSMLRIDRVKASQCFVEPATRRMVSAFMMLSSIAFMALWLSEIVPALVAGTMPASALAVGFPVNPVHVIDLAIVLPGMMITGVLVWRNSPWGLAFAPALLVFMVIMGAAILGMSGVMYLRGLAVALPPILFMSAVIGIGLFLTSRFLKEYRQINLTG